MNAPNDIRWLMFATVPVHGYVDLATPLTRAILWLWRRAAGSVGASRKRLAETQGVAVKQPS
jgi:hypothetical protein